MTVTGLKRTEPATGNGDSVLPRHVALIMDGNGRWAAARGLSRSDGHRKGVEAVRRTVRHAVKRGIRYLTLFSFSSENWSRPRAEVAYLMGLLQLFVQRDLAELMRNDVRVVIIGSRERLARDLVNLLDEAERKTRSNAGLQLVIAFNYGARQEIVHAARALAREVAAGRLSPDDIDIAAVDRSLQTYGIPDPDMIIRTSGEQRISNFLLWQSAYSELVFVPTMWPDFDEAIFDAALSEFAGRERRYGGIGRG